MSKEVDKRISKKLRKEVSRDFDGGDFLKNRECYIKHLIGNKKIITLEELEIEEAKQKVELKAEENVAVHEKVALCISVLSVLFSLFSNGLSSENSSVTYYTVFLLLVFIFYIVYYAINSKKNLDSIIYCQFKLECIEMYRNKHKKELEKQQKHNNSLVHH